MKLLSLALVVAVAWAQQWVPSPELGFDTLGYPHTIEAHENIWVSWQVQPLKVGQPVQEQRVRIAIAVNADGWAGIGLTETGGMRGADICVVRQEAGLFRAFDMHSFEYAQPILDDVQDCTLVYSNQANGETMHIIERPADLCHPEHHDLPMKNLEQRFIFAYGASQQFAYHGATQRTTYFVNMFDDDPPLGPPDLPHFEIHFPGHEIPAITDSFMCSNFTFPIDQSRDFHVVTTEPFMNGDTNPFAHHIISFGCLNDVVLPDNVGPEGSWECLTMAMPGCNMYALGWSVGQRIKHYPDHIGVPMGRSSALHVVMQMHSNNIFLQQGVRDTSGFRLFYTEELREFSVTGITTGLLSYPGAITLPPNVPEIAIESECPASCINEISQPLQVWSINWHMHQTGKSVHLSHVRDGVEIGFYGINHWDYNWQGDHQIEEFTLLPGDRLYSYCSFDTTGRTEPTYGGDGTQDEMCYIWISLYGGQAIGFCTAVNQYEGSGFMITSCGNDTPLFTPQPFSRLPVC